MRVTLPPLESDVRDHQVLSSTCTVFLLLSQANASGAASEVDVTGHLVISSRFTIIPF